MRVSKASLRTAPGHLREIWASSGHARRQRPRIPCWAVATEQCARQDGSDFLSIRSAGKRKSMKPRKADIQPFFAMGVLGCRDMEYLWGSLDLNYPTLTAAAAGDSHLRFACNLTAI